MPQQQLDRRHQSCTVIVSKRPADRAPPPPANPTSRAGGVLAAKANALCRGVTSDAVPSVASYGEYSICRGNRHSSLRDSIRTGRKTLACFRSAMLASAFSAERWRVRAMGASKDEVRSISSRQPPNRMARSGQWAVVGRVSSGQRAVD
eukprot:scaffold301_cov243-Pinguiococcus_pyrenoidosus.AAC.135